MMTMMMMRYQTSVENSATTCS